MQASEGAIIYIEGAIAPVSWGAMARGCGAPLQRKAPQEWCLLGCPPMRGGAGLGGNVLSQAGRTARAP
jgi:hypothetical protein